MNLETSRLILRPLALEDHKDIQKHFPHWKIVRYMSAKAIVWPYPEDGALKFIRNIVLPTTEKGEGWYWGITTRKNPGEVIGVVHLRRSPENGNRSFWLAHEHQNKGYMSEALEAVNDFAFNLAGFDCLVFKNARANAASNRLKVKTGAELLGVVPTLPGHYVSEKCREQEIWCVTRESWQRYKQAKAAKAGMAKKAAQQSFPAAHAEAPVPVRKYQRKPPRP